MNTLWNDLKYALRLFMKRPGFTAMALLTLTLGIGGNTAIFSIINAALMKWGDAFHDPDRLVMVWKLRSDTGLWSATPADFRDWRDQNRVFEKIGAYFYGNFNFTGQGEPERILGGCITSNLFPLLGVQPVMGRTFLTEEEKWDRHRVVLLSHGLWKRRFGSNPNIVGQTLQLNGEPFTVVGVMPPGAWFANTRAEMWVPFAFAPTDQTNDRRSHFVFVVARLASDVTLEQALRQMKMIARQIELHYPENSGFSADVTPLRGAILGNVQPMLLVLLGAVGFVLLIACANIANLLLAKAAHRKREIAIRLSLGATRGQLIRQLLCESILLAVIGGVLGLGFAVWGVELILKLIPISIPRIHEIAVGLDGRVLAFTGGLSILTGILFGLIPALQSSKSNLTDSLKEGSRGTGIQGKNIRNVLVVSEVALALILSVGSGLMIRSFLRLMQVDIGVKPDHVLTMQVEMPPAKADDPVQVTSFFEPVLSRVQSIPGVVSAGITSHLPLSGGGQTKYFTVEGHPVPATLNDVPTVSLRQESTGSFAAMGMQILQGRSLSERDTAESPRVAVINEAIAKRFFPKESPIGKQISLEWPEHLAPPDALPENGRFPRWTIVGVVRNVHYGNLNQPVEQAVYISYLQRDGQRMAWAPTYLVVRSKGDPLSLARVVRDQVWAVDRNQPVSNILSMEQLIQTSFRQSSFTMVLLSSFAAVAMLLAALGIYGVMSFLVAQRTNEIGVRMALGARQRDVLQLVLKEGMLLVAAGISIGLVASFALSHLISSLLFGVGSTDTGTFVIIPQLIIVIAFLACYVPARVASKVDPIVALRYE
jgi:putative ABC transport system permease protein